MTAKPKNQWAAQLAAQVQKPGKEVAYTPKVRPTEAGLIEYKPVKR